MTTTKQFLYINKLKVPIDVINNLIFNFIAVVFTNIFNILKINSVATLVKFPGG